MKTILSYSFIALSVLFIILGIKKMNEAKKSGQINDKIRLIPYICFILSLIDMYIISNLFLNIQPTSSSEQQMAFASVAHVMGPGIKTSIKWILAMPLLIICTAFLDSQWQKIKKNIGMKSNNRTVTNYLLAIIIILLIILIL